MPETLMYAQQYNILARRLGLEKQAVPGELVGDAMFALFMTLIDRIEKLEAQCKSDQAAPPTLQF